MIVELLIQTSSPATNTSTDNIKELVGFAIANVGAICGAILFFANQLKEAKNIVRKSTESANEIIGSKDEILQASKRNLQAIKANTSLTQQQSVAIQKHQAQRMADEIRPLKERINRVEELLEVQIENQQQSDNDDTVLFKALTETGDVIENPTQINE